MKAIQLPLFKRNLIKIFFNRNLKIGIFIKKTDSAGKYTNAQISFKITISKIGSVEKSEWVIFIICFQKLDYVHVFFIVIKEGEIFKTR